jgi:DNA polymerase-1
MEAHVTEQSELRPLYGFVNKIFLVDSSWLLHKSFYGYTDFSVIDDHSGIMTSTGDIHGFLMGLLMMIRRSPDSPIILCLDSRNNLRKKEHPEYKSKREYRPDIWKKLFEIIQSASLFPNVYLSAYDGYEGDDIIYTLSKKLSGSASKILIYGYDKDLMQCVNDRCVLWNKCDGSKFIERGIPEVRETFKGCEPENVPFFRSVCGGDSSDSLGPGYPRFPRSLGARIANLFGSPERFLQSDYRGDEKKDAKWVEMLRESPDSMISLFSLMKARFIEGLPVYRCNSTWDFIEQYKLSQVKGDFVRFLPFSNKEYVPVKLPIAG